MGKARRPNIRPFSTDKECIRFAQEFLGAHVKRFRKDILVCLTGTTRKGRLTHAYFPALITCIAFADFLTGLYVGKLEFNNHRQLFQYADKFMDRAQYDDLRLGVLYHFFRHKLAHLSHPYAVFDTRTKAKEFPGQPNRRITWMVYSSVRRPAIELIHMPGESLKKTDAPWPMPYDHRIKVSVRALASDIAGSVYGPSGYLSYLRTDPAGLRNFVKCMEEYFPR